MDGGCITCKHFIDTIKNLPDFSPKIPDCSLGGMAIGICGNYEPVETKEGAINDPSRYCIVATGDSGHADQ